MHDPPLWAEPAQRAVADQLAGQPAQVGQYLLDVAASQKRLKRADGTQLDVVPPADREDVRVAGQAVRAIGIASEPSRFADVGKRMS